jgi:hypothetical protein
MTSKIITNDNFKETIIINDGNCIINVDVESLTLDNRIFQNNTKIKKIIFPDNLTTLTINDSAFEECKVLETIIFPDSLKTLDIGTSAFKNCTSLDTITFPSNLTTLTIGGSAFEECKVLETIIFPDSLKTLDIGSKVFTKCDLFQIITFPTNISSLNIQANPYDQYLDHNDISTDEQHIRDVTIKKETNLRKSINSLEKLEYLELDIGYFDDTFLNKKNVLKTLKLRKGFLKYYQSNTIKLPDSITDLTLEQTVHCYNNITLNSSYPNKVNLTLEHININNKNISYLSKGATSSNDYPNEQKYNTFPNFSNLSLDFTEFYNHSSWYSLTNNADYLTFFDKENENNTKLEFIKKSKYTDILTKLTNTQKELEDLKKTKNSFCIIA